MTELSVTPPPSWKTDPWMFCLLFSFKFLDNLKVHVSDPPSNLGVQFLELSMTFIPTPMPDRDLIFAQSYSTSENAHSLTMISFSSNSIIVILSLYLFFKTYFLDLLILSFSSQSIFYPEYTNCNVSELLGRALLCVVLPPSGYSVR